MQIGFTDPWWDTLRLRAAQAPFTFNIDPGWNWTDVVNVGLTVGLVALATAEILSSRATRKARERAADRRVNPEAAQLQHMLIWWLGSYPSSAGKFATLLEARKDWCQRLWDSSSSLRVLLNQALALAVESSETVSEAVNNAAVRFYKASQAAGHACTTKNDQDTKIYAEAARIELMDCEFWVTKAMNREMLSSMVVTDDPPAPPLKT